MAELHQWSSRRARPSRPARAPRRRPPSASSCTGADQKVLPGGAVHGLAPNLQDPECGAQLPRVQMESARLLLMPHLWFVKSRLLCHMSALVDTWQAAAQGAHPREASIPGSGM